MDRSHCLEVRGLAGAINCMIFSLRAFSVSSFCTLRAEAFRLREAGTAGVETLNTLFAIRVR